MSDKRFKDKGFTRRNLLRVLGISAGMASLADSKSSPQGAAHSVLKGQAQLLCGQGIDIAVGRFLARTNDLRVEDNFIVEFEIGHRDAITPGPAFRVIFESSVYR